MIVDRLDSASDRLNQLQSELNSTLRGVSRATGAVVGDLAGLCAQLDELGLETLLPEVFIRASVSASRVSRSRRVETAAVLSAPTLATLSCKVGSYSFKTSCRAAQMFQDFWRAVTRIFRGKGN